MGDILFLAHRIPFPPDRGDKIRSFHLLKHLAARHRVHLIAFADEARDLDRQGGLDPYTASRAIFWRGKPRWRAAAEAVVRGLPVSLTAFESRPLAQAVAEALQRHPIDTIFVFSGQMAQYLPARPAARVIMDFVDMDSAKFEAYADQARGASAMMMQREARLLFDFERRVALKADASLFVSAAEAKLFADRAGCPRIHVVENGIGTEKFAPGSACEPIAPAAGPMLVFTGQMDYRPNIEAVGWFAEHILPLVRQRHPQARFAIVGRAPTEAVQALARPDEVIVTGEVADVRPWLTAASVVVAPLKLARGVQNKVLEAMAMARPLVASSAAAEGIDHGGTIRVGEDAAMIADQICALLYDPAAAATLGQSARRRVIDRYSWAARLSALDPLIEPCKVAA